MFRWAWPRLRRVVRQREPPHNRLSPDQPSPEKTDRAVWAAFALYSDRLRGQAPRGTVATRPGFLPALQHPCARHRTHALCARKRSSSVLLICGLPHPQT